ncbi:MAG TPA: hypothetical protein VNM48_00165 [Chloroflexota bacterium]|nr:hypothetical protein [Chloroflexota bacterium]
MDEAKADFERLQADVEATAQVVFRLIGSRIALETALVAIIRSHPLPEQMMEALLVALAPATEPDTLPLLVREGWNATAQTLLDHAVQTGVQGQARRGTKN